MKNSNLKLRSATKLAFLASVSLISFGSTCAFAQTATAAAPEAETIVVLGSRLKRVNKEGPAPVTVITSQEIAKGGYASVPDVLRSVTANTGATQSQQDYGGAITTPGAAQVDLRGLGPNHTLVMVNGRRVADFPMPYQGLSNFTDVSNIPISLIEKVEVLSGSASAIYGSDAVAGVVNFTLKDKIEGIHASYKYGITEQGDGQSHLATLGTGFSKDKLNLVFGLELFQKDPIWQYDRAIQDNKKDAPTADSRNAVLNYFRSGGDATAADCNPLRNLAGGTMELFTDTDGDTYCGSQAAISYGTITSEKSSFSLFTGLKYEISDNQTLYANLQAGTSTTKLMNDVTYWRYQDADGNLQWFYNQDPSYDDWDRWRRIFTPEEAGGIRNFMTVNKSKTLSLTTGLKGVILSDWNYDLGLNFSRYEADITSPQTVAAKANTFFLGPILDVVDGEPTISSPLSNFYRALTPSQWASITERVKTDAYSQTFGVNLIATKDEIYQLPAGAVSMAIIAELDKQEYDVTPSANATNFGYYYGYAATSGSGSRDHAAIGAELKIPALKTLDVNLASRYDSYSFGGRDIGQATYNVGLEWRPADVLLVRAAAGSGFRAPDLHYVFANLDLFHPTVIDYYTCAIDGEIDCSDYEVDTLKHREGSPNLKPETSTSYNFGFVLQPYKFLDFSVDYFNIDMRDQVQDLSLDSVLRDEATCRIGNLTTPTCLDAISRVRRNAGGDITSIYINPINVSREYTDGIDLSVNLRLPTSYGKYTISGAHTEILTHTSVQYVGDPTVDQLAVDSGYTIPNQKSRASISFERGPLSITLTGNRLGKTQNFDEDAFIGASWIYNANASYSLNDNTKISFTINNLTDELPMKDATWTSYPYYNSKWFDSVGRAYFLELSHKF